MSESAPKAIEKPRNPSVTSPKKGGAASGGITCDVCHQDGTPTNSVKYDILYFYSMRLLKTKQ